MALPYEGTGSLPADDGANSASAPVSARFMQGIWSVVLGAFLAPRGTSDGNAIVQIEKGTPVVTQVGVTGSSALLLAANALRKKATFYNNGTSTVYISNGTASTATSYAVPAGAEFTDDTGQLAWNAITATPTQDVRVMEYS